MTIAMIGHGGDLRVRYARVAILLHWAIAALIIFNLCTGLFMANWLAGPSESSQPVRWLSLMLHVSSGMTVLALTIARVGWRLLNHPPPYPAGMQAWERHTSHIVHFLLYAAMVLMPLLGWGILSAHPPPGSRGASAIFATTPSAPPVGTPRILKVWNLFPLPSIAPIEAIAKEPGGIEAQHVLHQEFAHWHGVGGFLLLGLLVLHLLGALKHQFIDRLPEFSRMGIGGRRQA